MRTLVVAATLLEVAPLIELELGARLAGVGAPGTMLAGKRIDLLITGVGQAQCAIHVANALSSGRYDRVLHAGIAGSFEPRVPIGSVCIVNEECFGDLGAEAPDGYLDLFEMGLLARDAKPFCDGFIKAPASELACLAELPRVRSVTVNRVLSEAQSIQWIAQRYRPQIVNMEGAALFYAASVAQVPFLAIRSISDMVGPRDKSTWRIAEAVTALNAVVGSVLDDWIGL